jgi:hypothetical protein
MSETRIPSNVIPEFTLDIPMPRGAKPPRRSAPLPERPPEDEAPLASAADPTDDKKRPATRSRPAGA